MKLRYTGTEKGQPERIKISGIMASRGETFEASEDVGELLLHIGGFERVDAPPETKRPRKRRK